MSSRFHAPPFSIPILQSAGASRPAKPGSAVAGFRSHETFLRRAAPP